MKQEIYEFLTELDEFSEFIKSHMTPEEILQCDAELEEDNAP